MAENENSIESVRHSLAHLLAYSVKKLYPGSENAIGPAVDNGFYQDFEIHGDLSEDDLSKIEAIMKETLTTWKSFERKEANLEEALEIFGDNKYKQELAREFAEGGKTLTIYTSGDFVDLCKGGHVQDISTINPAGFKITKTAGAYWRGNEKNIMLTRIYGVAFQDEKELESHLQMLEEAKKRDHRKLGQELDLFVISDLVGPGLPLFTPKGTVLRNELIKFSEELQRAGGYEAVWAPHMTRVDLYKTSGHFDKYPERFDVSSVESNDEFMMKPMNCPHVTQIYASRPRSYRDLPLRYMETTTMYRDEKSGELHGLSRVRALTQDDSHAFVRHDQIETEMQNILQMVKDMYSVLDLQLDVELSFSDDGDGYYGERQLWDEAEKTLKAAAELSGLEYRIELGEAAFYGPKIDIYISDALGRRWQCATVQLDFVQPERFDLSYTAEDGSKQRPAMVHKAILGSIERFLSVYIEHTAGRFPIWLAPEQIRIITVNQEAETVQFADELMKDAKELGLRVYVDNNNDSVGKKIRNAEVDKVPYTLVIGEKEIASGRVMPRVRQDLVVIAAHPELSVESFLKTVANETKSRVQKTSL